MIALRVDEKSLTRSKSGVVWGNIWLEIDDLTFPEKAWSDSILGVLRWWFEGLLLPRKSGESVKFPFMDGPYLIELQFEDEGLLSLRAFEDRSNEVTVAEGVMTSADFKAQVIDAAAKIIRECDARGWVNHDTRAIEELLKSAR